MQGGTGSVEVIEIFPVVFLVTFQCVFQSISARKGNWILVSYFQSKYLIPRPINIHRLYEVRLYCFLTKIIQQIPLKFMSICRSQMISNEMANKKCYYKSNFSYRCQNPDLRLLRITWHYLAGHESFKTMKTVTKPKPTKQLEGMLKSTLLAESLCLFTIPDISLYTVQGRWIFSLFCATESLGTWQNLHYSCPNTLLIFSQVILQFCSFAGSTVGSLFSWRNILFLLSPVFNSVPNT